MKNSIIFLSFALALIFLMPMISALEWDNVKAYDSTTRTATLRNSFLGIPTTNIATLTLISPQTVLVTPGEDKKIAEITINLYDEEYKNFVSQIKFYDSKTMVELHKDFTIKERIETGKETVPVYETVCSEGALNLNGTMKLNCDQKQTGTKEVPTYEWRDYSRDFSKGEITIGIFTDVGYGDNIEWIPTIAGLDISEWAAFVGSTRYEYYDGTSGGSDVISAVDSYKICQTFTMGYLGSNVNITLVGVMTDLKKGDVADASKINISIVATNSSGFPNGATLTSNSDTAGQDLTTGETFLNSSMPGNVKLVNGTMYGLCVAYDVHYIAWYQKYPGAYGGGKNWFFAATNVSDTYNQIFEIWGTPLNGPEIAVTYPTNTTYKTDVTALNYTIAGSDIQACWYSKDLGLTNTTITCGNNVTGLTANLGSNKWIVWANSSTGSLGSGNVVFTRSLINSVTYNESSYETARESFIVNTSGASSASLVYNGTTYSATIASDIATASLTVPLGRNNASFYWKLNGGAENSSTYYQYVSPTVFKICNDTINVPYINITFKDESSGNYINGSIISSSWTYYLGDGSVVKTLSYTNTGVNESYAFCLSPATRNVTINNSLRYSLTGYPERLWSISPATVFSNSTYNKILYLLSSADGIYVTFQVINSAFQIITGANINATISSGLVASAITDSAGTATFWLDPNALTTIEVLKTGYPLYSSQIYPTQTSYTITLGGASTTSQNVTSREVTYVFGPTNTYLSNDTDYNFNFTINSTYYTLDSFGFNITNRSGYLLGSATGGSGTNGFLNLLRNTGNNTEIIVYANWRVQGENITVFKYYTILDTSNSEWSIANLFTDLNTYIGTGLFGLKKGFGLNLIIFITIFLITGVLSWKYGLTSPAAVSTIILALTILFDAFLGLVDGLFRGAATLIVGVITLALWFKGGTSY